ncbi:Ubiquitin domain-containing protein 2 [Anabarilius grahami]|uniref:Ubiquitin domain-containing protein 2 n=1 Tax=Anabarilius grahami TaxID=495550 RepID=A0A3N0XW04_ANAGA|nr:Ubiquitin domain-containing protein 2 [Anabarilius grahami]
MTDGQLRSKRDEFWDTAPAFEGRKEIWDALKAAAQAFESNDHELAQAIIDGASITLPHVWFSLSVSTSAWVQLEILAGSCQRLLRAGLPGDGVEKKLPLLLGCG